VTGLVTKHGPHIALSDRGIEYVQQLES